MALKDAEKRPLKPANLRELSAADLEHELVLLKEAQFRLRFRSATEDTENKLQFRIMRRNIARLETVLREKTS